MKPIYKFLVSNLIFFFLWGILILSKSENLLMPKPIPVFKDLFMIFSTGESLKPILTTLLLIFESLFYTVILGMVLGLLLGYFKNVYDYSKGVLSFLRSIPPIVLFPLFAYIIFKTTDNARIFVACFGSIPIIIVNIADGINKISHEKIEFAKINKAPNWFILRNIYYYELLPNILQGIRLALSFTIIIIVVTEMLHEGDSPGIGSKIVSSGMMDSDYNLKFAYIILIGIIGYILNEIVFLMEKKLVKW